MFLQPSTLEFTAVVSGLNMGGFKVQGVCVCACVCVCMSVCVCACVCVCMCMVCYSAPDMNEPDVV